LGQALMLVLASASPRRAQLLAAAGLRFVARPAAGIDETPLPGENASNYVRRLARAKAGSVPRSAGEIVLGADTTVVLDGEILGKPADRAEAARMLHRLSGRGHEVLTGICLMAPAGTIVDVALTGVYFQTLTQDEVDAYVASGEPFDKAGGYGIQGLASKFVERLDGCYFNVVGLPVSLVYRHLKSLR
jgi:septum formation protein